MYFSLNNHQELICHLIKCPSPNRLVTKRTLYQEIMFQEKKGKRTRLT